MKKLMSLMLTMVIMISLCISSKPIEVYANSETSDITSLEMNIDGKVTMTYQEQKMDSTFAFHVKEVIRSETDADLELTMTMGIADQSVESKVYYKDGIMYQEIMGTKMKTRMELETAENQAFVDIPQLEQSYISCTGEREVEGGKEAIFEVKKEYLQEVITNYLDSDFSDHGNGMTTEFTDCKLVVVTDHNNMPKSYQMMFGMNFNYEDGDTIRADYVFNYNIVSINTITEIAFPEDLDSYIEYNY